MLDCHQKTAFIGKMDAPTSVILVCRELTLCLALMVSPSPDMSTINWEALAIWDNVVGELASGEDTAS
jgi:hypothetical protein